MNEHHSRTAMLIGEEALDILQKSRVAVVGLGGVGGHCVEALARAGIGALHLIDGDVVDTSNLNRQLIATKETVGMAKTEATHLRVEAVSDCRVTVSQTFLLRGNIEGALPHDVQFIVDAVDTVAAKLAIIEFAHHHSIPIISCMGAGNRLDPSAFFVTDIYKTEGCPLARAVRQGVRKLEIAHLPVVMSSEPPISPAGGGRTPGSISFVPAAAGLTLAAYVVRTLISAKNPA
ncbi:ThiF family adenylyltransferase [Christensenellaceae bacterium OttesenSCG-928-M15]|nr:ThiF family adenylyltransferase [Christensenellaceae bacterium OttesenSCG-928-M15]